VLRSIGRRLPRAVREPLKRTYVAIVTGLRSFKTSDVGTTASVDVRPVFAALMSDDPKEPFSFVGEGPLRYLDDCFRGYHRNELLQIRLVRMVVARERAKYFMSHGAVKRVS